MSTQVYMQYTQFVDISLNGKIYEEPHYGYRIWDAYGQEYNDNFESVDELIETVNEENVSEYVLENHYPFFEGSANVICFNGQWIDVVVKGED